MHRYYEYCSKCDGIRSLVVSISLKKVATAEGSMKEVLAENYHCETCGSFIYSRMDLTEEPALFESQPAPLRIN